MQFKEVIGQKDVKHHLSEMVQQNRLSHALLFLGKQGSGALPLAIAFAQYIICDRVQGKTAYSSNNEISLFGTDEPAMEPVQLNDSCGECPSCIKAKQLLHPDIHFSYPVISKKSGDKPVSTDYITEWSDFVKQTPYGNAFDWLQSLGAENKQGNITSDECNEIIRKLSLKSFEGGYKILLLWMPEYLGKEGNKLLKLIEEPPANTLFILIAENEEQILPTILSRCQLVKIPSIDREDIVEALISRCNASRETAEQTASICEGNYREALLQVSHAEEDWQSLLREWLNAILKNGPAAQVKWIDEVSKLGREKQKQFLRYFNHLLEQSIRIKVLGENNIAVADNEKDFAMRLNKICSIAQQEAIVEELDHAAYYIERNANAKMLFHALTIKLYHIIQDKTVILSN